MDINNSIDFLICNYNCEAVIIDCIKSIVNLNSDNINILIYDNNSSDNSIAKIKLLNNNNIILFAGKENMGYGKAINYLAKKSNAKFIFILNPDTILDFDSEKLLELIHKTSKFDIIGFKVLNPDRTLQKHITLEPGLFWLFVSILRKGYPLLMNIFYKLYFLLLPIDQTKKNSFISGCALFMERNVFSIINGFNEIYFLYFEDTEFFKTAIKKNLVIHESNLTILHNASYSVKNSNHKIKTQIYKSALLYYKTNFGIFYFKIAKFLLFISVFLCILNPINFFFRKNIKYFYTLIKIVFEL
jgi:GT2 family glycosyltransferase